MIKKALITEKTTLLSSMGKYTFLIDEGVTKGALRQFINRKYGVDVLSVSIVNIAGKRKLQRSRKGKFRTARVRKAIVEVKKGQKIGLFEEWVKAGEPEEEVKVTSAEGEVEVREKKSLLGRTKVKIEKEADSRDRATASKKRPPERAGKTKGEK